MSLLSLEELRIVLCPERIVLLRTGHKLTLRGYQRYAHDTVSVPCEIGTGSEKPWSGAIETLEATLPSFVRRKMKVSVILSNHFVQYILVPWMRDLNDEEELAFAQHCFHEVYGSAADSWSVRISPNRAGVAALASAVDTALLDDLRGQLQGMDLEIKSIQPHLMTAYNSCRNSLEGRSAWVALLEPDNLCLALLQKGQLVWVRKLRIGAAWDEELPAILEREQLLADTAETMNEVLLWAPHLEDMDIPVVGRWQIRHLHPGLESGHAQEYAGMHDLLAEA